MNPWLILMVLAVIVLAGALAETFGQEELAAIQGGDDEVAMCSELEAWCASHDVPYRSADELCFDEELNLSDEERAYLRGFIARWDALVGREGGLS